MASSHDAVASVAPAPITAVAPPPVTPVTPALRASAATQSLRPLPRRCPPPRDRPPLTVAVAQIRSHSGDLVASVDDHVARVHAAADLGARLVQFPELSLTGYEPDLIDIHGLRFAPSDPLLRPLAAACKSRRVDALVGAPIVSNDPDGPLPSIGVLHVRSTGQIGVAYRKCFLGIKEIGLFSPGHEAGLVELNGWRVALGVCREAGVAEHVLAASRDADAYLVGALYLIGTQQRLLAHAHAISAAGMWAVLAQYSGGTGGGPACGASGIWRPGGAEMARLGAEPGVAVATLDR